MKTTRNYIWVIILLSLSIASNSQSKTFRVNRKADGYKGLWSSSIKDSEGNYFYSGGSATATFQNNPVAIYSPEVKKTFFVYGGTTTGNERHLQIMVSYHDNNTGLVPRPVIVYEKEGVTDCRDNPSISIDGEGHILVFVSGMGRTRPGMIFRSTLPYSIDSFDLVKEGEMVLPQPWLSRDDTLLVVYKKFLRDIELYFTKSADSKSWTKETRLTSMGGNSSLSGYYGNRLWIAFTCYLERNLEKQSNLYLMYTDDNGRSWKNFSGEVLGMPLTNRINEAMIRNYEDDHKYVYLKDMVIDETGNPVILAIISDDYMNGNRTATREWDLVSYDNGKWEYTPICKSGHNHDTGVLYLSGNRLTLAGTTEPGPQKDGTGGAIAIWESTDKGKSWSMSRQLTYPGKYNYSNVRRPINPSGKFYCFWSDGDPEEVSECNIYFSDFNLKATRVLPYDMKRELELPDRIK
ncbi:MAG: BNR-4 repeat-containing protein [Bacteroidales bacterium]